MKHLTLSLASGIALILALLAVGLSQGQYVMGAGLYDDDVPLFSFQQGSWSTITNASYYGGTALNATAANGADSMGFTFYGDSFTLWVLKYVGGGDAIVCIDQTPPGCSAINTFSSTNIFQHPITFSGLAVDEHTVRIITTSAAITLDAVFIAAVEPEAIPTSVIQVEVTVEVTAEVLFEMTEEPWVVSFEVTDEAENFQTVAFEYKADAGQLLIAELLFGILLILLVIGVVQIWRHINHDD